MPDALLAYADSLAKGVGLTLAVFGLTLFLSLLLGLTLVLAQLSGRPWIGALIRLYTTVFRGLPEVITILTVTMGSAVAISWLLRKTGLGSYYEPNPFVAGVVALTLTFGAYATEIFRSAFMAVPRGDIDAAYCLGLERRYVYGHIVIPQMLRFALPGLNNMALVLLKDTALLSVIGVNELMRQARVAVAATKEPFTFYLAVAGLYLALTCVLLLLLRYAERYALRGMPPPERANHGLL